MHTTNKPNCFITVSPDSKATSGQVPPVKNPPSVAQLTYEMIRRSPYVLTSDDVIFGVWAQRKDLPQEHYELARHQFFSKGQPCLRTSDLCRRYGWGVHSDALGKLALFAVDSAEYRHFVENEQDGDGKPIEVIAAMRSAKR